MGPVTEFLTSFWSFKSLFTKCIDIGKLVVRIIFNYKVISDSYVSALKLSMTFQHTGFIKVDSDKRLFFPVNREIILNAARLGKGSLQSRVSLIPCSC